MEERASRLPYAGAGLFATVVAAWLALLGSGGLSSAWLLAGVLAIGLGLLVLNLLRRLAPGLLAAAARETEEPAEQKDEPASDEAPRPRLRVLMASCGLEALAVALLTSYLVGDVLISLAVGAVLGGLAAAVSLLLARKLAPA